MTGGGGRLNPSRLRLWLPAITWAAVLFVLSAVPGDDYPPTTFQFADKVVHAAVYLVLGLLCARALVLGSHARGTRGRGLRLLLGAALATAYGMTDEFHQLFVPGRSADWYDVAADAIGAFLGAGLLGAVHHAKER